MKTKESKERRGRGNEVEEEKSFDKRGETQGGKGRSPE